MNTKKSTTAQCTVKLTSPTEKERLLKDIREVRARRNARLASELAVSPKTKTLKLGVRPTKLAKLRRERNRVVLARRTLSAAVKPKHFTMVAIRDAVKQAITAK